VSPSAFKRAICSATRILLSLSFASVAALLVSGCSDEPASKRRGDKFSMYDAGENQYGSSRGAPIKHYLKTGTPIEIAVVWNSALKGTNFWEGADLAVEEINSIEAASFPKLKINRVDSAPYLAKAGLAHMADGRFRNASQVAAAGLAEDVLANHNNVAVVGHAFGENTATSALLKYERQGLLFLSSATVDKRFASLGSPLAFSLFPSLDQIADRSAAFGEVSGITHAIIIHQLGGTDLDPIPAFRKQMAAYGINRVDVVSFKSSKDDTNTVAKLTEELAVKMREAGPHVGLILLVEHTLAGLIFEQLSVLKLTPPMLAASRVDVSKAEMHDMYPGFTFLDVYSTDRSFLAQKFGKSFKIRYPDLDPTRYAALAYDHIRLLYQALLCADTVDPGSVALTMRYNLPKWYGATGAYDLFQAYSNQAQNLIFRQLAERKGKFVVVTLDF